MVKNNETEIRQCQSCKLDFTIEPEDFKFYEKIKVPPPTWCRECRLIRRLVHREERALYKDKCDKCDQGVISSFAPETSFVVYCLPCWWGDSWDGRDYGKDYDFTRPFFQQLHALQKVVPNQATSLRNCTNCKYAQNAVRCKDCTFVFGGFQSINCHYCQIPIFSRDSIDSDTIFNADYVYETLNSDGVYNTRFTYFSDECFDCSFIFNCLGCKDCFGCINLRNQKYNIWNIKYTKEEYKKEILKWDLGSYQIRKKAEEKFWNLYLKTPRRFAHIINSNNVSGDYIKNTRNSKNCFVTIDGVENCKNIFICGLLLKDSYDTSFGGDTSDLLYEANRVGQAHMTKFSYASNEVVNVEYSDNIFGGKNLFGCVKLRNKKYCILNKQYSKEKYESTIPKIKKHMNDMPYVDSLGRVYKYGEFFPPEHSLWAYNETWANQWFPLSKKEAKAKGFNWRDEAKRDYKITIKSENLPDHISDVPDSILNEIISCGHARWIDKDTSEITCNQQCTTAYRILPYELSFYRSMKLALPRLCPNCRFYERLLKKNPPKLWRRACMCGGVESSNKEYKNTREHDHGNKYCTNEFETAISDKRKEIVYCEKCYQVEFV